MDPLWGRIGKIRLTIWSDSCFQDPLPGRFQEREKGNQRYVFHLNWEAIFVQKRAAMFTSCLDSVAVGKSLEGVVGWDFCCVLTLQLCQQVLGHDGWIKVGWIKYRKGSWCCFKLCPWFIFSTQNQAPGTSTACNLKVSQSVKAEATWWELPLYWLITSILAA